MEGEAPAPGGGLEPVPGGLGVLDEGVELGKLALGQSSQLVADWRTGPAGGEEVANLLEREAGPLAGVDHGELSQDLAAVAASAGDPFGLWEHADRLVVANRRRAPPDAPGDLTDAQPLIGGSLRHVAAVGHGLTSSRLEHGR